MWITGARRGVFAYQIGTITRTGEKGPPDVPQGGGAGDHRCWFDRRSASRTQPYTGARPLTLIPGYATKPRVDRGRRVKDPRKAIFMSDDRRAMSHLHPRGTGTPLVGRGIVIPYSGWRRYGTHSRRRAGNVPSWSPQGDGPPPAWCKSPGVGSLPGPTREQPGTRGQVVCAATNSSTHPPALDLRCVGDGVRPW